MEAGWLGPTGRGLTEWEREAQRQHILDEWKLEESNKIVKLHGTRSDEDKSARQKKMRAKWNVSHGAFVYQAVGQPHNETW